MNVSRSEMAKTEARRQRFDAESVSAIPQAITHEVVASGEVSGKSGAEGGI
jgi:hypothetical protein